MLGLLLSWTTGHDAPHSYGYRAALSVPEDLLLPFKSTFRLISTGQPVPSLPKWEFMPRGKEHKQLKSLRTSRSNVALLALRPQHRSPLPAGLGHPCAHRSQRLRAQTLVSAGFGVRVPTCSLTSWAPPASHFSSDSVFSNVKWG